MSPFTAESGSSTATPMLPLTPYFGGALTLTPGNGKVTAAFAPVAAGAANGAETGTYRVSYKKATDSVYSTVTVPAIAAANGSIAAATVDVTALTNGTAYTFTVAVALAPAVASFN